MKKVLLASTAVAAFVAFSSAAQAQDPGMADFGATEGGGKSGSAFTVTTSGAVKFYLKYATGSDSAARAAPSAALRGDPPTSGVDDAANLVLLNEAIAALPGANDGLFTLVSGELEINGAATTDNGIDISTHVDFSFAGSNNDSTETIGGSNNEVAVGRIAIIDELSLKIAGGFGSVELGSNDGAEDVLSIHGGSVAAGTGGIDGDQHTVTGGVGFAGLGGNAGSGDSSDALKVTYLSPVFAGVQAGVSLAYSTEGPYDGNGGDLGVGLGVKYSGSGGGVDYAVSLVWGDSTITRSDGTDNAESGYGGLGIGVSVGGAGVSFATGVTIDDLGAEGAAGTPINWSGGIAYAIADSANVSLNSAVQFRDPSGAGYHATNYLVVLSGDYAVLPGVTLALDLGYGDSVADNGGVASAGFTGVLRVKAAF